jgi:hypothetical protein
MNIRIDIATLTRLRCHAMAFSFLFAQLSSSLCFADDEVLTFKGDGTGTIKIIGEKGDVKEEVKTDELKQIRVKPRLSIPKEFNEPAPRRRPSRNAVQTKLSSADTNKMIDKMLETRRKTLRKRKAMADQPPRKR